MNSPATTGTAKTESPSTRPKLVLIVGVAGALAFTALSLPTRAQGAADAATQTQTASAAKQKSTKTGFVKPFAGKRKFLRFAPKEITDSRQLHRAIGQKKADRIAKKIGLSKKHVFTKKQFRRFVSGKGKGGDKADAKLVDQSVRILTNTKGRPLVYKNKKGKKRRSVLASYGLMVNKQGLLQSPANTAAPTRQVNVVLAPGGYLGTWSRANGAKDSLRRLYKSAYTVEAVYGNKAQQQSGVAQLVTNKKRGKRKIVGMSMAPALWLVNFALIYTLRPSLAAEMPARWAKIPRKVARAIKKSPTGQVPYQRYRTLLNR